MGQAMNSAGVENSLKGLLVGILGELRQGRVQDDLWSAGDIAAYLKLKKSTVQSRLLCLPHFPKPVTIPTTDEGGGKRWIAKEVKAWALKQR
jgi:hypothetical protein